MKFASWALSLACPSISLWRHPFPGPGLAVRCLGEVTKAKLDVLREADQIVVNEIKAVWTIPRDFSNVRGVIAGAKRRSDGGRADV